MVSWSHLRLQHERGLFVPSMLADLQVAHKSDLCGLDFDWKLNGCADAVLEQLSQLIYLKLVHESLTFLAQRMLEKCRKDGRGGVSGRQILVLLAYA
eukprot:5190046-Amphidinium_carterae.1